MVTINLAAVVLFFTFSNGDVVVEVEGSDEAVAELDLDEVVSTAMGFITGDVSDVEVEVML